MRSFRAGLTVPRPRMSALIGVMTLALLGLSSTFLAHATSDTRRVGIFLINGICLAQDNGYRGSRFAREFEAMEGFPGWDAIEHMPITQCARQRKWVPPAVCASALNLRLEDRAAVSAWLADNEGELRKLSPVFESLTAKPGSCPS